MAKFGRFLEPEENENDHDESSPSRAHYLERKNPDPRNWGDADLDEEEIDQDTHWQQALL